MRDRQARRRAAGSELIDHQKLFEMYEGKCGICTLPMDPTDFHVDHIVPLSRGGEHTYANVQPTHPLCNLSKGAKLL